MPENYLLVGLIEKYSGILLDGDGALQTQGIEMVLELEDIKEMRHEIIEKIIVYVSHAKRIQRSR